MTLDTFRSGCNVFRMERTTSRAIAEVVSQALTDSGKSLRDAATTTGIPLTTLSRRLTGNSSFTVDEVDALACLLGLSVSQLAAAAEDAA